MRKNHSKIVCIKLVHLPYLYCYGLKVLENRVVRKTLGSKREEVKEEWRKLHNEKLRVYGLAHCSVRTRK